MFREHIYNDILETIGDTPLVRLNRVVPEGAAEVLLKLEWFNPGGSVKDRIGYSMIVEAEKRGEVLTGVLYVAPDKPDFFEMLNMDAAPLATLPQSRIRPAPDVLDLIMEELR